MKRITVVTLILGLITAHNAWTMNDSDRQKAIKDLAQEILRHFEPSTPKKFNNVKQEFEKAQSPAKQLNVLATAVENTAFMGNKEKYKQKINALRTPTPAASPAKTTQTHSSPSTTAAPSTAISTPPSASPTVSDTPASLTPKTVMPEITAPKSANTTPSATAQVAATTQPPAFLRPPATQAPKTITEIHQSTLANASSATPNSPETTPDAIAQARNTGTSFTYNPFTPATPRPNHANTAVDTTPNSTPQATTEAPEPLHIRVFDPNAPTPRLENILNQPTIDIAQLLQTLVKYCDDQGIYLNLPQQSSHTNAQRLQIIQAMVARIPETDPNKQTIVTRMDELYQAEHNTPFIPAQPATTPAADTSVKFSAAQLLQPRVLIGLGVLTCLIGTYTYWRKKQHTKKAEEQEDGLVGELDQDGNVVA